MADIIKSKKTSKKDKKLSKKQLSKEKKVEKKRAKKVAKLTQKATELRYMANWHTVKAQNLNTKADQIMATAN